MKGIIKRAKIRAKGVVESIRPLGSRQELPLVAPPGQPDLNPGENSVAIPVALGPNAAQPALSSPPPAMPAYARPAAPPSALSTSGAVIHELLATIRDASDTCLPLKAAVVAVLKIWDVCERTVELNHEFINHKEKLERLLKIASTYRDEGGPSDNLHERLEEIAAALQNLANAVQAKLGRGLTSRALQSSNDIEEVKDLVYKTMSLVDVFEFEGGVRVEMGIERVETGVEQIQYSVDQVRNDVDEVVRGVDVINQRLSTAEQVQAAKEREAYLERLQNTIATALDKYHVREAVYDAQQRSGCMRGTRVDVLDHVFRWIMDPKSQPIFWLGGMAGTGKTSIAWSICERVQADDTLCLGGSFFCSRSTGSVAQRDVRRVIPTLAQLLARQSNEFAAALAAELKEDPDLAYKQVKVQVERLLRKPLAALSPSKKTVVFIIDALDECGDQPTAMTLSNNSEAHAAVSEMLEALIDFSRSSADVPVKFIVTSRPETHIRGTSVTDTKFTSALHLHKIDKSQVTSDIRLYIGQTLSNAPATDASWFNNEHVETLAERADGLFIFAATATKYIIGGGTGHRVKRLTNVVSPLQVTSPALAFAPLDLMYSLILMEASRSDMVEVDELQQMLKVVAAIISARMTLSIDALAELLNLSTEYLRGCLDSLHAVVHLPEDNHDAGLRTLHASFGDYLFTRASPGIRISSTLGHDELARGCLRRMKKEDFDFNISRSPSSHEPNPKTEPDWISLSLRYACLHWAHHIQSSSVQSAFDEAVNAIFRPKFLFWLEVLSVLNEIRLASGLLRVAGFALKSTEISRFLHDANSFVASSRAAIEWSAPHIYISALPFAPKDFLVFRDFAPSLSGVVSVETFGIDRHGGRLVMNLTGHTSAVRSVAYSSDGRILASGSEDGTVRLWDTLTGEETMPPLQSGDARVRCVAFATDSQRVVSCTYSKRGAVHLWDARTGRAAMSPLRGHSKEVWSVALSSEGRIIASASADNSVRLWDAATGQAMAVLNGHERPVRSVAFSSDGYTLASGSHDSTIRLWDIHTFEPRGPPLQGPDGWVLSVAFSPDGSLIAAAFDDAREIRIWNVSTRDEIVTPLKTESATECLAFTPDGSCLASSGRGGIRFWDWRTGQDVAPVLGHSGIVTAISYSPDGLYIATASTDHTVRIWDAEHSQPMTCQLPSHTGNINSVAVSADGSFIVSGSADQTIRVWNLQMAESAFEPLIGHSDAVLSVAVSADGQFIASGSQDSTVRLWDAKTGEPVGKQLTGHRGPVNAVTFSRDVQWLASASADRTVGLWALAGDGHPTLLQLRCPSKALSVAFSSNGQLLAVGDYMGYVTVWNLSSHGGDPEPVQMRVNDSDVVSVCFTPDNSKIVAASFDNKAYVWDITTRSLLQTLEGHGDSVRAVTCSPDGGRLVTGSNDGTIRIWDASTGHAVTVLHGHVAAVRSIFILPDGKSLISSADNGTIRSWDLDNTAAPLSQVDLSPADILAQADHYGSWLVGLSRERLIWVPQEYHPNLVVGNDSAMLIGGQRIVVSASTELHLGTEWTKCWRGIKSTRTAGTS